MLHFNDRFYTHLLDGFPVPACFKMGVRAIKAWEDSEGVKPIDSALPSSFSFEKKRYNGRTDWADWAD
jgi:hypothetical protein